MGGMRALRGLACVVVLMLCGPVLAQSRPLEIPQPKIGEGVFEITKYGAVGDGKTVNTQAIQKAIDACAAAGGGKVVVPAGRFVTGAIKLSSNMELHVDKDGVLLLSENYDDFPLVDGRYSDAIVAEKCHDIAITGPGTIDGNGKAWWDKYRKRKLPGATVATPPDLPHRPFMIVLDKCERVWVKDILLTNSPMFHLVPRNCDDVMIENIRIIAPDEGPNTDGIDPAGHRIHIRNCFIDVGDDNIAVKPSGKSTEEQLSCEDILIENCKFVHGHGMSIGGQTPGGLRRMTVRNCAFEGTENGLRLKAARGSGGLVEDVVYENIAMKGVGIALYITGHYPKDAATPEALPPATSSTKVPQWRKITFRNISAEGGEEAGRILGLPELPVREVVLENVNISAKKGLRLMHVEEIEAVRTRIKSAEGEAVILQNATVKGDVGGG